MEMHRENVSVFITEPTVYMYMGLLCVLSVTSVTCVPAASPERVERDFTLEVEVYCSVPVEESSSKPSTPIKMLKKLRSRVGWKAISGVVNVFRTALQLQS